MREYILYLMKEEVARKYVDKETKLLLSIVFGSFYSPVAKKQLQYITDNIPRGLNKEIFHSLQASDSYLYNRNIHTIESGRGQAALVVSDGVLLLTSQGDIQAEKSFLEVLRTINTNLFAIEKNTLVYSWLTMKKSK